jgi:hypothetical protein
MAIPATQERPSKVGDRGQLLGLLGLIALLPEFYQNEQHINLKHGEKVHKA